MLPTYAFQKEVDEKFGISINDTAIFDYPNLSDLAAYVFTLISENSMIDNESEIDVNSLIEKIPDEIESLSIFIYTIGFKWHWKEKVQSVLSFPRVING